MPLPAFGGAVRRSEFEGRELRESGDSGATDGENGGEGNVERQRRSKRGILARGSSKQRVQAVCWIPGSPGCWFLPKKMYFVEQITVVSLMFYFVYYSLVP